MDVKIKTHEKYVACFQEKFILIVWRKMCQRKLRDLGRNGWESVTGS